MSRLFGTTDKPPVVTVPRPLGQCGVSGCNANACVVFAYGSVPSGADVTALPGVFVMHDWSPRTGYTIRGYVERCGVHYSEERMREAGQPIPWIDDEHMRSIRSREDFIEACHGIPYADFVARRVAA